MKIGPHSPDSSAPVGTVAKAVTPPGVAAAAPVAGGQSTGVSVSLSSKAQALGGAATSSANDVDAARVEAFRAAIAAGTFKPDPGAIADKLLSNAQEMLDRVQR